MVASLRKRFEESTASEVAHSPSATKNFDFGEFFHGHTRASGWFADRFGKPRRHFCGDFYGYYDAGRFILDEKLYYTDGLREERIWTVSVSDDGVFTALSDSLIGPASGIISGNTLSMRYSMKVQVTEDSHWSLDMRDRMILQPDGSLHNINHVYKWGLRIGTVAAQYLHHDGDSLCASLLARHDPSDPQSLQSA